jgi:hypothetical protein
MRQAKFSPRVISVAQLARRDYSLAHPIAYQRFQGAPFGRFRLGSRWVSALTIHLTNRAFVYGRLYDFNLPIEAPILSSDDLPDDWKAEYKRVMAAISARVTNPVTTAPPPR